LIVDIVPFGFEGHGVLVVMINEEVWFDAINVCKILDLRARDVLPVLDEDERMRETIAGTIIDLISEPGLYSVIMRSRKPEAKAFKRWVTHEVLPQIRQQGSYLPVVLDDELQRIFDLTVEMQRGRDEQRRLEKIQVEQGQQIAEIASDVADLKVISPLSQSSTLLSVTDVAHACGTGRNRMIKWLREMGIIFPAQQGGGYRAKQHPWMEGGWAVDRYERRPNGSGHDWVVYFTSKGLTEIRLRWDDPEFYEESEEVDD